MISELLFKNGYNQERYDISENGTETRFSNSKFKITRLFLNPFISIVIFFFFYIIEFWYNFRFHNKPKTKPNQLIFRY